MEEIQTKTEIDISGPHHIGRPHTKPMRAQEAADYLGVRLSTLYRWTARGILKPLRPGGKLMIFYERDLDAQLARYGSRKWAGGRPGKEEESKRTPKNS
jgi:excisionase family DNA binding protein